MTTRASRGVAAIVGAVAAVSVAVGGLSARPGTATAPAQPKAGGAAQAEVNFDPVTCKACHENGKEQYKAFKSDEFVRLDENKTWLANDPHSRAFDVLKPDIDGRPNETLRRMERVLGERTPGYKAVNDVACLACHSTDKKQGEAGPREATDFTRDEGTSLGITCAGCHGANVEWQTKHFVPGAAAGKLMIAWRTKSPEEKTAAGMKNLRDPMVKADLCASCHVGNPTEGKVVTHEMYAAGHPPLPPFELVTFMQDEPRHWGYPHELPFFAQFAKDQPDATWKTFRYYPEDKEVYLARHAAAGAVAALKAEMALIEADAAKAAGGGLVDFARFDCYACHHDLRYPSARQERGYYGVPGRPTLKAWVAALPGVVAAHAATLDRPSGLKEQAARFDERWAAVQRAAQARPFGDAGQLAAASKEMAGWCNAFADKLDDGPAYDKAAADRLLAAVGVAATSEKWVGDAEAVMHLTWAYRSLREAVTKDAGRLDPLGKYLPLHVRDVSKFPAGRDKPVVAGEVIPERQRLMRDFPPEAFRAEFKRVTGTK
jgi:hypothetical protein